MKRALIIGAGGIGKRHIRGFLKTGRAALMVCEPEREKLDSVMKDYPITSGFRDVSEAPLDRVDLAVIATPAHLHVPIGKRLAEAGVPFLTEKPLSVSMDGVDDLLATVKTKRLTVRVGYVRRSTQWMIRLREQLAQGRIGRVRMVYINLSQDFRKYRPDYAKIYYAKKAMGGGAILDGATHAIDVLLWTMGRITEVVAMYDRLVFEDTEAEDSALISLRFASGAMAQISMNQFQKPNECTFEFIGEKGNLRVVDTKAQLQFANDDSGNWQTEDFITGKLAPMEIHESKFAVQANAFMDALEGHPDSLTTLEEARDNLAVCLAAKESYETKRIVRL